MFALHTSNRSEILFEQLVTVLEHVTLGPFEPLQFVIQGRGMERWLKMQLAKAQGVFAHGRFDFPHRFFAGVAASLGLRLHDEAFDRARLLWLLDAELKALEFQENPVLRRYLGGPGPELRRFQLARQLANLFDQYQIQRPDWLAAWQQGKAAESGGLDRAMEAWQAALWRRVYPRLKGHRGLLWQNLIARLAKPVPKGVLPQAVYLFGIGLLPPLMVEVLKALAQHTDVHLFVLSPVEGFWADLPSKRARAQAWLKAGPEAEWVRWHHPLLVALGQRGAQFQRLLLEKLEPELHSAAFFRHDPPRSVLQHLQNDLAAGTLTPLPAELPVGIELHLCHTPLREMEVVRDRFLQLFAQDPSLTLEDMAVMAPDIGAYRPYLEAVLRDLPHHIADRVLGNDNELIQILLAALKTLTSRFEWTAVIELLGRAPVREKFGLNPVDLVRIEDWIAKCAIRWGLDGAQRAALGLPEGEHNSWRLGVDRLLLGWMLDSEDLWQEVVPYAEVEGQSGAVVFRLAEFVRTLQFWWAELKEPRPPTRWRAVLREFSRALVAETRDMLAARQALEELLETLPDEASYPEPVGLEIILDWLGSQVEEEYQSLGFLSGGITCCTMLPMRAVPFKVVAVVGMNDGAFPRRETPQSADLIAAHPRLGDRDLRQEQRHQFLELILSTREHLILCCQGLTPEKNEPRPVAQVVSELIDTLDRYGVRPKRWIYEHPSLPFHPVYFRAAETHGPPRSVDRRRFSIARARPSDLPKPFWPEGFELAGRAPERLSLKDLLEFYADAQDWFCRNRLNLAMRQRDEVPQAREPFAVDGRLGWRARKALFAALEVGQDPWLWLKNKQKSGEWPQGEAGRLAFAGELAKVRRLQRAALALGALPKVAKRTAIVTVEGVQVVVTLADCRSEGSVFVEFAKFQGKHFFQAWLKHAFKQAVAPSPSWLVALTKEGDVKVWRFDPLPDWADALRPWLVHFLEHWNKPSPWLAEWGWRWILERDEAKWRAKCPLQGLPEAFALLFAEPLPADFPAAALAVYRSLLTGVQFVELDADG
ncbi:exodeoxyribonuclease V subunit gamma [Methylothermus subterraneus]